MTFDSTAELAVLSLIVKNPGLIDNVRNLNPTMFSSIPNKNLFKELRDMIDAGITLEFNLIMNYLNSNGKLAECGGEAYLNYLYSQNYDDKNLEDFERIIVNSYKAQSIISSCEKVKDLLSNPADVDSVISYLQENINNISTLNSSDGVSSIKEISDDIWNIIVERTKSEEKIEISTGFKNIDAVTGGYWEGDVWIVAGRPGMGKSASMCNSVLEDGKLGIPSLIISLEMSREMLIYRLVSIVSGIPIYRIRLGILTQKELDLVYSTLKELNELPIFIDSTYLTEISHVLSTIRKYRKSSGIRVVHLDYIQILAERSNDATHILGQISRNLKLLSNELGITSVIYSQLNRELEKRLDKRPILSDLRQSGNLEEDADVVMFLYRDVMYNKDAKDKSLMEQIIAKQRNGPTGTVMAKFEDETNRIYYT